MLDFLMSFKICEGITKPILSQLSFYLKEKSYKRNFTVFREGQSATGLYFIKSGEFEISKSIKGLDVYYSDREQENLNEARLGFYNPQATRFKRVR